MPDSYEPYWNYLAKLIAFPTSSAIDDAGSFEDCISYLNRILLALGFTTEWSGSTKRIGFASLEVNRLYPWTILYQHYDVQPPGDEKLWHTSPFLAAVVGERMYGRGAQDNKGQLCYVLSALDDLTKKQSLRSNVLLILDGEEECGSPSLETALSQHLHPRNYTQVISFDGVMPNKDNLGIVTACRGFFSLEVDLEIGRRDVHSGYYGGVAPNPIHLLMEMLGSLLKSKREIATPPHNLMLGSKDPEAILSESGLYFLTSSSPSELNLRMTLTEDIEIVGITAGKFTTSIPHIATARIIVRTPPGANATDRLSAIINELEEVRPSKAKLKVRPLCEPISGFLTDPEPAFIAKLEDAAASLGLKPLPMVDGGCNPGVSMLRSRLKIPCIVTGVGLPEDCIHAPNESFSKQQFEMGAKLVQGLLSQMLL